MPKITLCVDARMANSAGIGTCIREIVPRLNPSFSIVLLVSKLDQPWCKGMEQILFQTPIYSIQEQLQFPLKIPRCDFFWSPHYNVPLLPIRAKKRMVTIHDACHLALGKGLSFPERIYAKFVMKRALHSSDVVVTDSQFSKQELIRFLGEPKKTLNVIAPAVDPRQFSRVSDEKILVKAQSQYALPKRFVLFVGSQKLHKNLHGLLAAFSKVLISDMHLVIVGKKQGLRHSVENVQMKKVHWLGEVAGEDLPALYTLAELFVFPSFYEGFGLPPLEAMSCGCPTVVSRAASLPEVCGEGGWYVDPQKTEDLAEAIDAIASNPEMKKTLIQKGYVRASSFAWEDTAFSYRKAIELACLNR